MTRRARLAAGALLALGSVLVAVAVALPRLAERSRLAAAVKVVDDDVAARRAATARGGAVLSFPGPDPGRAALLTFDDPEVALALLRAVEAGIDAETELKLAVELLGVGDHAGDPRVAAGLESLARRAPLESHRFLALYLLEELRAPSLPPEPRGFAPASLRVRLTSDSLLKAIAELRAVAGPIDDVPGPSFALDQEVTPAREADRPWRLLLGLSRLPGAAFDVEVRDGRATLVPGEPFTFDCTWNGEESLAALAARLGAPIVVVPPATITGVPLPSLPVGVKTYFGIFTRLDHADPLKALRALAAFQGLTVHAVGKGYEVRKP